MASSTGSSSLPSGRAPSPSPSPRSMRFAGARQPLASTSSSFLPVPPPPPSSTTVIPHSQADLDRLQMERALEELSMMSSSRASSSFVTRSSSAGPPRPTWQQRPASLNHRAPAPADDSLFSHDDFGSSVEFARANSSRHNLSALDGRPTSLNGGGSSFNTTGGGGNGGFPSAPSPVSTNGHHASAITLRTGLVGSGLPTSLRSGPSPSATAPKTGFDDERELAKMLGPTAAGASDGRARTGDAFGFSGLPDFGYGGVSSPPTPKAQQQAPRPRSKLVDALGRTSSAGFSPRAGPAAGRGGSPLRTEESLFTTLARGVEDQLLLHRQPLREQRSPAQAESGGGVRRATSAGGGGKKKRSTGAPTADSSVGNISRRPSGQAARARAVSGGGGGVNGSHQQASLYLPDVTGLSEAVGETPLRPTRRPTVQEGRETAQRPSSHSAPSVVDQRLTPAPILCPYLPAYPLPELETLQTRLRALETENANSHRRIANLEDELRLTRERAEAAREEWAIERQTLGRHQRDESEGEWERRYYEVVEQKKGASSPFRLESAKRSLLTGRLFLPCDRPRGPCRFASLPGAQAPVRPLRPASRRRLAPSPAASRPGRARPAWARG